MAVVEEVLADALQEGKRDLAPKHLVSNHQESEAFLARKVEGVLVACYGHALLACRGDACVQSGCTEWSHARTGVVTAASHGR